MKTLTKYQLSCNGYMVSELGQTRISLTLEHTILTQAIGQNNTQVKNFTDSIAKAIGYK